MSKIDDLINKLCPNGVEFKDLEKCCNILDNKRKPVTKSARISGEFPYYGANGIQDYVSEYIFDGRFVLVGEDGSVINDRGNPIVTWAEGKIWVNNHAHIIEEIDGVLLRYLFHYIQTVNVTNLIHGNIPKLNQGDFRKIQIAVPPIEVQCEIVHILDDFTLLSAELSAELKARQQQYEYYKNNLLSINGIEYKLGDVADFKTGTKPTEILNIGEYEYINAGTTNSGYTGKTNFDGDKVTTPSRGQGGIGFVGYQKNDFWLGPLCYAIWSKDENILLNKYLYYELSSKKDEILKRKNTGGVPALNGCDLKTIPINIPKIDEQIKIINILDKFEKICEDISEGLPAEIEARQKQYEYYRDKLLTFIELEVNEEQ